MKSVHPVYGAGIQTQDLDNMSLLPYQLDQGSLGKICLWRRLQTLCRLARCGETVAGDI